MHGRHNRVEVTPQTGRNALTVERRRGTPFVSAALRGRPPAALAAAAKSTTGANARSSAATGPAAAGRLTGLI
jgi:hypothetical protein